MDESNNIPPVIGARPPPLPAAPRIPMPPRIPPPTPIPPAGRAAVAAQSRAVRLAERFKEPGSGVRVEPGARASSLRTPVRRRSLLTPAELERYKNLLVFARSTVEGFFVGKHKSPHRGSSVEFTDYKEYVPGDDVHRIDWRAFGRSRRLYVRQYEAETDMTVYLLVDVSASMDYAGGAGQSKYVLAARVAAALSYLMIHQGDKAALVMFADTLNRFLPAGGTRRHLHHLVTELENVEPASTTGMARALAECHALFKKRGRIVVLSDFWDDQAGVLDALSQFLHRKFEILLLQVMHPHELDLPGVHAARFTDMETREEVEVEPEEIRAAYRATARERMESLAREANNRRIQHAVLSTEHPYLDAIEAYPGLSRDRQQSELETMSRPVYPAGDKAPIARGRRVSSNTAGPRC